MPAPQYIDCTFTAGGRRYCFRNSTGTPAQVGDRVEVMTPRGLDIIDVVGIWDHPPAFDTRPIDRVLPR